MHSLIQRRYAPLLEKALDNRGLTFTLFAAVLILTVGVMNSGIVRVVLFPDVPGDFYRGRNGDANGTAPEVRDVALERVEIAALEINAEYIDANLESVDLIDHVGVFTQGDIGGFVLAEIYKGEDRPMQADEIIGLWREKVGEIAGMKELTFSGGDNVGGNAALGFKFSGSNYATLERVAEELGEKLSQYNASSIFAIPQTRADRRSSSISNPRPRRWA